MHCRIAKFIFNKDFIEEKPLLESGFLFVSIFRGFVIRNLKKAKSGLF